MPSGRELLVAGQKSGVVYALDPDQKGRIVWQTRVGRGSTNGGVQWGMASDRFGGMPGNVLLAFGVD